MDGDHSRDYAGIPGSRWGRKDYGPSRGADSFGTRGAAHSGYADKDVAGGQMPAGDAGTSGAAGRASRKRFPAAGAE